MAFSTTDRDRLAALLREHSVKTGEFRLASGKTSSIYVNVKSSSLLGEGADLMGRGLWELACTAAPGFDAVGGLTLGADPLVTAIAIAGHQQGSRAASIIVRKTPKEHGTMQYLEMPAGLNPGDCVVAVDDVITSGGSTITAIERLREAGFVVNHAVCVVDRLSSGEASLEAIGVALHSLYRLDEFVDIS
ncbi:MAG: orotate phosphoribosyltransferase [Bradymonadaceae bacterium]